MLYPMRQSKSFFPSKLRDPVYALSWDSAAPSGLAYKVAENRPDGGLKPRPFKTKSKYPRCSPGIGYKLLILPHCHLLCEAKPVLETSVG